MSEGPSQLFTQPAAPFDSSTYSDGLTITGCGLTQEKKEAAKKPKFVDFACSHSEVGIKYFFIFLLLFLSMKGQSIRFIGHGRSHSESALGRQGKL